MPRLTRALSGLALAGLVLQATPARAASVARVIYQVKAQTLTWMPIRLPDLEQGLAAEVVAVLGQGGLARLEPAPKKGTPPAADDRLRIHGEVVEQAGNFTVTLVLRPLRDPGRPSFVTSATVTISGRPKAKMYTAIIGAARQAAQRLARAMQARRGGGARGIGAGEMVDWGKLVPPPVRPSSRDLATTIDGRLSWDKRKEAAFRVAPLAFDDDKVRRALARMALVDPDPVARYYALRFLEPSSRSYPYIQQVILAVLREEADPKAKGLAFDLSQHFVGLSPEQTMATWVQLLTAKVAELANREFGALVKQLRHRVDAPNLDVGLAGCLSQQEALREGEQRKALCLELVERLPARRRTAVLLPYLNRPLTELEGDLPQRRLQEGPFSRAVALAVQDRCEMPTVRRVLLRLLSESPQGLAEAAILVALGQQQMTDKVARELGRLLQQGGDSATQSAISRALSEAAREPPWGLLAREALGEVLQQALQGGNRRWGLDRVLKRLRQLDQQPHRAGLAKHLRADEPPRASAVDYLAGCVARETEEEAAEDCAEALSWLAVSYPQHRRQAVAAAHGLLRSRRRELPRGVKSDLKRVASDTARVYRKRPRPQRWESCPLP